MTHMATATPSDTSVATSPLDRGPRCFRRSLAAAGASGVVRTSAARAWACVHVRMGMHECMCILRVHTHVRARVDVCACACACVVRVLCCVHACRTTNPPKIR